MAARPYGGRRPAGQGFGVDGRSEEQAEGGPASQDCAQCRGGGEGGGWTRRASGSVLKVVQRSANTLDGGG